MKVTNSDKFLSMGHISNHGSQFKIIKSLFYHVKMLRDQHIIWAHICY